MKRGRHKRKSRTEIAKLKDKLWELCKLVIRKRDGDTCYACGKSGLVGSNWHTGHFIPSVACGGFLRYELRNLYSQCYNCNINLGGNGTAMTRNLVQRQSQDFVDQIWRDKQNLIKVDIHFIKDKIEEYTKYSECSQKKLNEITFRHVKKVSA